MKKFVILFIFSIFFSIMSADGTPPAGTGTETDPYQISSLENLLWLSTSQAAWTSSNYFLQTQDIDASDTQNWNDGDGFSPIGLDQNFPFEGNYDGGNHIIDDLYIHDDYSNNLGFFGCICSARIESLGLTGLYVEGNNYIGGLAGNVRLNSSITGCYATGTVRGDTYIGGLSGINHTSSITRSFSDCDMDGDQRIGGLVGFNYNGFISDCYATDDVDGDYRDVGGLVGLNNNGSVINNSYATGDVDGDSAEGGLVGKNDSATINNCVWNTQTTGQSNGIGQNINGEVTNLTGATTLEMKEWSTYTSIGWDFQGETINGTEDIWNIHSNINSRYPYVSDLEWCFYEGTILVDFMATPLTGNVPLTVTFTDLTLSLNILTGWEWDFQNDGIIDSYEQNPVFIFEDTGVYSVSLTVANDALRDTAMVFKEDFIVVQEALVADFTSSAIMGNSPLEVQFTDISCSEPTSWEWDFQNDGIIDSIEQNPIWIYNEPGVYSVSLTVSDDVSRDSDLELKEDYIIVQDDLFAQFTTNDTLGFFPYEVQFSDSSIGDITSWQWDFQNDGIIDSYDQNPYWVYNEAGCFDVSLTVSDEAGRYIITEFKQDYIVVIDPGTTPAGNGTDSSPYLIASFENLIWLSAHQSVWDDSSYFLQTHDIDATETQNLNDGAGFSSIGLNADALFCGNYNGDNHLIDGIYINRPETSYIGLFGRTQDAVIENLGVTNVDITGNSVTGSLVGLMENCFITASYATGNVSGNLRVGGLAGQAQLSTTRECYSTCTVNGEERVGGLVGYSHNENSIINCFATGNVSGNITQIGGLAGINDGSSIIGNCYATGNVDGDGQIGALIGRNADSNVYSCVWNTETSGQSDGLGSYWGNITDIVEATTAEMQMRHTYDEIGWDFPDEIVNGSEDIWDINILLNGGYPYCSSIFASIYNGELLAQMAAYPKIGNSPLTVDFVDTSISASTITGWQWDFQNDGIIDSYDQNPTNVYIGEGNYSVSLTVIDENGLNNSRLNDNYIEVFEVGLMPQGSGTETDPFEIATLDNLLWLSSYQSFWTSNFYYIQTQDIDASPTQSWNDNAGFSPIGLSAEASFCGNYNGDSHFIDGLFINRPETNYIGLFGRTQDAVINSLWISNVDITGNNFVGALVGVMNYSSIINSFASGSVIGNISIGGLAGQVQNSSIEQCFTNCELIGEERVGGLTGYSHTETEIINCYASGNVYGNDIRIGGLVGLIDDDSFIAECYATGYVEGGNQTGAFAGENDSAAINNCVWNIETSGQLNGLGSNDGIVTNLIGASTGEMQLLVTYTSIGWDFYSESVNGTENIWDIDNAVNESYPYIFGLLGPIYNVELLAQFYACPTGGTAPLTVCFFDDSFSVNTIVSREWDFNNDGIIDSYNDTPEWTYTEQGSYSVSLTVSDAVGRETSTELKHNYIFAANEQVQPVGSGSESDPYLIADLDNLLWLSTTQEVWNDSSYFVQTQDIDATQTQYWNFGAGFSPIGLNADLPFNGNYYGNNHYIDGLYIYRPDTYYTGLFGYTNSATLGAIEIINVNLNGNSYVGSITGYNNGSLINESTVSGILTGLNNIGGIAGMCENNSSIDCCSADCEMRGISNVGGLLGAVYHSNTDECQAFGYVEGEEKTGGLIGYNDDESSITECHAAGNVSGFSRYTGGLVGFNEYSEIIGSYASGDIGGNSEYTGGLVGWNSESSVNECYATGLVNGTNKTGGLIGYLNGSTVSKSYARGNVTGMESLGGLVGWNNNSEVSNSYSLGNVTGDHSDIGGLAGYNNDADVSYCFATGNVSVVWGDSGGLLGHCQNSDISNCVWNIDTTNQQNGIGTTYNVNVINLLGVNTEGMQLRSTYTDIGWDFTDETLNGENDIWDIHNELNNGYAYISDLLESIYNGELLARFDIGTTVGNAPLEVNFLDTSLSENSIVSWQWDFQNDGIADSFDQNPVFIYEEEGIYSVSLTVTTDENDTDIRIKENCITTYHEGYMAEGSGTELDPYQISSLGNLLWLSTIQSLWSSSNYFIQTQDIDASDTQNWNDGDGFSPIGLTVEASFCGNYNGEGHVIDSLYIHRTDSNNVGLFGRTAGANIDALKVTNANITGTNYVGALGGNINNDSIVNNCYTSGTVDGEDYIGGLAGLISDESHLYSSNSSCTVSGIQRIGGLIGFNNGSTAALCFATGNVSGSYRDVGGLIGLHTYSTLNKCYATGNMTGNCDCVGGLVGTNNHSTISDCYAKGSMISGGDWAGGLVGFSDFSNITDSYATGEVDVVGDNVGGLVGRNRFSDVNNCIWNVETTLQTAGLGYNSGDIVNLIGATTAEMQSVQTYTDINWDFLGETANGTEDIWDIHNQINNGYPHILELFDSVYNGDLFADFSAVPIYGNMPLTVNFADDSLPEDSIVSWQWDFQNDGIIDSDEQNPVFTYDEIGIYSVSLTIGNDISRTTSSTVREAYIIVINENLPPQGSGTETDPFLIASLENLLWLSDTQTVWDSTYHFLQTQDIDASSTQIWNSYTGFQSIGLNENLPFRGSYNGGNHVIDGLYIDRPETNIIGLFGCLDGAYISFVGLTNVNIHGDDNTGGLAGEATNFSVITDSYVTGIVSGNYRVGGLAGENYDSTIENCYSKGTVSGYDTVGGLAGRCILESTISRSYSCSDVTGRTIIGGLVGYDQSIGITDCFTTGTVIGSWITVGGLVGHLRNSNLSKSYATGSVEGLGEVGGLVGYNQNAVISDCVWNVETTGQTNSCGANEGTVSNILNANTEEMLLETTYTERGWDFVDETVNGTDDIWDIVGYLNNGCPFISELESSIIDIGANFEGIPNYGSVPLSVSFFDRSVLENPATSWQWDFDNDGETDSIEQNPVWVYNNPGYYSVSLIVANDFQRETYATVKESYISALPDWSFDSADYEYSCNIWGILYIDEMQIQVTSGTLGCFVGDECRGIASLAAGNVYEPSLYGYTAFNPTVFADQISGELISFKYWDQSEGKIIDINETLDFVPDLVIGSSLQPFEFHGTTAVNIDIPMYIGWNWFSLNVSADDMSTNTVLSSIGDSASNIKSQTQSAIYYPGPGWLGSLNTINNFTFYKINATNPVLFEFTGYPVDLEETVYNLTSGWNWLSYAPQESENINYAYSSIQYGTNIKSQAQSAIFYPGPGWLGSLTTLNPLGGYMLNMSDPETFTYPEPEGVAGISAMRESAFCKEISSDFRELGWSVDPHAYEFNGSLWATIEVDGKFADDVDDYLAVFCGDECRGLACRASNSVQDYSAIFGHTFFLPMVYSNVTEGEELSFKYYDASEETVYDIAETVMFESDMVIGNGYEPFVMHAVMTDGSDDEILPSDAFNCYPNPFNPETTITFFTTEGTENTELCIYNLKGQKVCTLVDGMMEAGKHEVIWNAQSQSSGIYYMKLQTGSEVKYRKVILLK